MKVNTDMFGPIRSSKQIRSWQVLICKILYLVDRASCYDSW